MTSTWKGMVSAALLLAAGACLLAVLLFAKLSNEGAQRRDQACRGLELGHKQETIQLGRTYQFYLHPPAAFKDLLKNPLVVQQLKDQERDARRDQDQFGVFVPAYCDEPGVGLPEPDPIVPYRPSGLHLAN